MVPGELHVAKDRKLQAGVNSVKLARDSAYEAFVDRMTTRDDVYRRPAGIAPAKSVAIEKLCAILAAIPCEQHRRIIDAASECLMYRDFVAYDELVRERTKSYDALRMSRMDERVLDAARADGTSPEVRDLIAGLMDPKKYDDQDVDDQ